MAGNMQSSQADAFEVTTAAQKWRNTSLVHIVYVWEELESTNIDYIAYNVST